MTGFCGLPERVRDLAEIHGDDAIFYAPAPDGAEGFVLTDRARTDLAALETQHAAEMAEIKARTARAEAELARRIITGAVRDALLDAGADAGLVDGATALFIEQIELVADADEVVTTKDSGASVAFAAGAWLDANAAWRGRRRAAFTEPGAFTARLRAVLQ